MERMREKIGERLRHTLETDGIDSTDEENISHLIITIILIVNVSVWKIRKYISDPGQHQFLSMKNIWKVRIQNHFYSLLVWGLSQDIELVSFSFVSL